MRQVLFSALVVWALSLSFTALGEEQAAAMPAGEAAVLVNNDAEAIAFKNIASERTVPEINDLEANALEVNDLEVNAPSQSTSAAFEGHDLSPWGMYLAADAVVKSVIITLLLASLITWTILCFKLWQLRKRRSQAQHLLIHLSKASSFSAADLSQPMQQAKCLMLLDACKTELDLSADLSAAAADAGLNEGLKERMLTRLNSVQASLAAELNHGTGVLATIGSVAPFVGLFGTVWGIMNSFIGIAETQTTNLAVVAPGIAEALLATAIGLVAAIPAVVIYNYFARAIGAYRAILADLVAALMILTSRDLDRAAQQKINDEEQDLAATDDKGDEQGDEPVVPALQGAS